ncbi:MAG: hypothetical protein JWN03_7371 [Nocardia sp.]|uniref:hypothetical protein n=1 Tax=Nocardia sp. TaxID=1821 RepID=UPI0026365CE4|nr:hypothetical protein [Nocardia sp.]MCU1647096.1 hypothetical protein [Nocardia sp.]
MAVRYELRGVEYPGHPRTIWRFGDPECPLRLAQAPLGVGGAPMAHVRQANARQAGATYRGTNREINPISITVRVGPVKPGEEAFDLWSTWRESLGDGTNLAEWHVITPGGGLRWQYVRLETAMSDPPYELLDTVGWCTEDAVLVSDESWWNAAPVNPPAFAPDQFAGRSIRNDGDVPTWPFWRLTGPGAFSIGLGTEKVLLPKLQPNEVWTVETNPEFPHIKDWTGKDVWSKAGNVAWYHSASPKTTVPLNIEGIATTADSRVEVWLPQKYQRAAA